MANLPQSFSRIHRQFLFKIGSSCGHNKLSLWALKIGGDSGDAELFYRA